MLEVSYNVKAVEVFSRIYDRLKHFNKRFIDEAGRLLISLIREEAPKKTGFLRESVRILDKGVKHVSVGPTAPYAIFVELGTKAHEILPRKAQALRFWIDGEIVFAKRVWHPGFPGKRYIQAAYEKAREQLPKLAEKILRELIGG